MKVSSRFLSYVFIVCCFFLAGTSLAQSSKSLATLALDEGPDREQRPVQGARQEGTLTVYTSLTVEDVTDAAAAFEKQYGIKLTWAFRL